MEEMKRCKKFRKSEMKISRGGVFGRVLGVRKIRFSMERLGSYYFL
jgi:hypothetical protein